MLLRLDGPGFDALEANWGEQCATYGDEFGDYARPYVDLARNYSNESPAHPEYGIFALPENNGIVHIGRARLPKTQGQTLRVLWLLLAPRYDYEDVPATKLAELTTALVLGVYLLARNSSLKSDHVKIHLGNSVDRSYFTSIAVALGSQGLFKDIEVKGQWLHFSL
jgi:hypothetical protein